MGRALGVRFAACGHEVCFGSRRPEPAAAVVALAGPNAHAGSIADAAAFGSVVIWTARERDPAKVLPNNGGGGGGGHDAISVLDGKVVVDLNNRDYAHEVVGSDARWFDVSLGEALAANLPKAHVVKCFNTIAMEVLDTSAEALRKARAQIFVAGASDDARRQVAALAAELGFEATDLGAGKTAMRAAEALGDVVRFCIIGRGMGGRANIAVNLLPEPDLNAIGGRQSSGYH
jgi:hypothetical protein